MGDQTTRSLEEETRLCTAAYALGERGRRRGRNVETCAGRATSIHPVSAMTDDRHYDLSITIVPGIAAIPPSLPLSLPARKLQLMANIDCSRRRDCPPPGLCVTHNAFAPKICCRRQSGEFGETSPPPRPFLPACSRIRTSINKSWRTRRSFCFSFPFRSYARNTKIHFRETDLRFDVKWMEEEGRNGFRTVQWIRLKISSRGGSSMEYLYVGYTVIQIGIFIGIARKSFATRRKGENDNKWSCFCNNNNNNNISILGSFISVIARR